MLTPLFTRESDCYIGVSVSSDTSDTFVYPVSRSTTETLASAIRDNGHPRDLISEAGTGEDSIGGRRDDGLGIDV